MASSTRKKASKGGSYKAGVLLGLFHSKYDPKSPQDRIEIPIREVVDYLDQNDISRPGNIHNFFKDLVRTGKMPRFLAEIADNGYQLVQTDGGGAFVKSDREDLDDIVTLPKDQEALDVSSNDMPKLTFDLVRTDEGGVISVIEYCGILGLIFEADVFRVQTPLKVQPNEVDGCYIYEKDGKKTLLSVEAKSKGSDVLLKHQIYGAAAQSSKHFGQLVDRIVPLGVKIASDNTVYIIVFNPYIKTDPRPAISSVHRFRLEPIPPYWVKQALKEQPPLL